MTTPRRLVALCALGASFSATAQIAVSVNDNKMALDNGMPKVAAGVSIAPVRWRWWPTVATAAMSRWW